MLQVKFEGYDEYLAKLKAAPQELKEEIDGAVGEAAQLFVKGAKRDLVSQGGDRGSSGLSGAINFDKVKDMSFNVFAAKFYAPYVEFGTKKKVSIEPGFEAEAAAAKGLPKRGGELKFFDTIRAWVKRKGIGATYSVATRRKNRQSKKELDSIAFLIARSILINGISPKPFFFKQYRPVKSMLISRVKNILGIK
jgi:hypothetical protein